MVFHQQKLSGSLPGLCVAVQWRSPQISHVLPALATGCLSSQTAPLYRSSMHCEVNKQPSQGILLSKLHGWTFCGHPDLIVLMLPITQRFPPPRTTKGNLFVMHGKDAGEGRKGLVRHSLLILFEYGLQFTEAVYEVVGKAVAITGMGLPDIFALKLLRNLKLGSKNNIKYSKGLSTVSKIALGVPFACVELLMPFWSLTGRLI